MFGRILPPLSPFLATRSARILSYTYLPCLGALIYRAVLGESLVLHDQGTLAWVAQSRVLGGIDVRLKQ
jgi:hypothetical protein